MVEHRPEWAESFEDERRRLEAVFIGTGARIEHVGSTAVPGLAAKPIVDIGVGLRSLRDAETRIDALAAIGYHYVPEYEAAMPERRYFRRPESRPRSHHLHCLELDAPAWARHLAFRDHLRTHPDVAREYGRLKVELARRAKGDRSMYTDAKGPFIERVLGEATP